MLCEFSAPLFKVGLGLDFLLLVFVNDIVALSCLCEIGASYEGTARSDS